MFNARIKFVCLFILFLGTFLVNTQYTDADIFAEREVAANKFSMTSLDFFIQSTINKSRIDSLYNLVGLTAGGYDLAALKIKRDGKVNFKYQLKTQQINGDDVFCNSLNLIILKKDFSIVYSGKLMDLKFNSQIDNKDSEDWIFFLSLDQNGANLKNKICGFNFSFKTYRNNPDEKGGIYAQRLISNVVSSGSW